MGLKDLVTRGRSEAATTRTALEASGEPHHDPGAIDRMVTMLLDVGLDGRGPLDSVREVADEALRKAGGDREKAIAAVARRTTVTGGIGGFVTGIGGYVTMPVALPVNVAEFYLQATRMVGIPDGMSVGMPSGRSGRSPSCPEKPPPPGDPPKARLWSHATTVKAPTRRPSGGTSCCRGRRCRRSCRRPPRRRGSGRTPARRAARAARR